MDLRTLAVILFKFWARTVLVFVLFVALGVAACVLVRHEYTASNIMLVKIGRELIYRADVGSTVGLMENIDKDQIIASNISLLTSSSIAEQALSAIGIDRLYPELNRPPGNSLLDKVVQVAADWLSPGIEPTPMSRALYRFSRKLSVDAVKKTSLLNVSFTHPDPDMAARVANLVVSLFQQRAGEIYNNPNLVFEESRVRGMQSDLAAAENRLSAYRVANNAFDLPGQLALLLKQRSDVETKLTDTEAQIVQLQGLTAALAAQIAVTPKLIPLYTETERHRSVDDATSQLMQLQLQERQLATRFGENYPQLAEVRNQIKAAQAAVTMQADLGGTHSRTGLNDIRVALEQSLQQNSAQLQAVSGLRDTLRGQIKDLSTSIAALSKMEPELALMQREIDLRSAAVKQSYDKLVEARAVEGLSHEAPASFSVVQPAIPPDPAIPSKPRPLLYMLGSIVLGGIGALVTTFLSFRMFGGFLTTKQVAHRLNRPILAVIDYNASLASWPGAERPRLRIAYAGSAPGQSGFRHGP